MKTPIKIGTISIKTLTLFLAMNTAFVCANATTPSTATTQIVAANADKNADKSITITGIVKKITFGKDGYSADVQTEKRGTYAALVSSANLGGPDKYKSCEVGDKVSFKGDYWMMGAAKQLTVKEIISIDKSADESTTITGIVKKITFGKDGYSADVQTEKRGTYAALVSSANMGGPDKYKSCEVGDKVTFKGDSWVMSAAKQLTVKEIISIDKNAADTQLSITEINFRGIQAGDAIASHADYTKKIKLKTGEGSFDVYEIRDFENNRAGYFMADPKNKLLVGDITIESPKATTNEGLKVGDSFQALSKIFPLAGVHGSEIEGRTYATTGRISYRLDVSNFKYDVDKAKIPAATKITQIIIERDADVDNTPSQTPNLAELAAKYEEMKDSYISYQTSKVLDLHAKPASDSKVEGKHFAGQCLSVLGTKMVNKQLWVNVKYSLNIKGGYEGRFPNNRIAPGGVLTGWIGGAVTPEIGFK
jgi:hypothetical protein